MIRISRIRKKPGRMLGGDRLEIKRFQSYETRNRSPLWRNSNEWREYTGPLAPGTYAMVGGEWRNVKNLDPLMLAHV